MLTAAMCVGERSMRSVKWFGVCDSSEQNVQIKTKNTNEREKKKKKQTDEKKLRYI